MRAIVFDAVGTLIHPQPGVAAVYSAVGRRHGCRLDDAAVAARFKAAFRRQEQIDRENQWITSEARERQRWRDIVAEVLTDVDFEPCFAELYEHFARPSSWRVEPSAASALQSLRGMTLAMASNFDERLHGIVAGLPELASIREVIVSSEVGVRKPGRGFFLAIEKRLHVAANEIIFVGDDPINDGEGAAAAGMTSILLGRDLPEIGAITIEWVEQRATSNA